MSRTQLRIEAEAPGSRARAGRFQTLHGEILTPLFMPVGTQATVRNIRTKVLKDAGSQILLANTYHLFLRPGKEVFDRLGSIHKFMNWSGSVLTDSGGFQVFSLPGLRKIEEEGAVFHSYVDGLTHLLSPETSIGMQRSIGADIMMAMDVCIPSTSDRATTLDAMERTHRWALRSLAARGDSPQSLFGIVQGACHLDLRRQSAEFIAAQPFDGLAIGGLAVGETKEERERFTEVVTEFLPRDRPRYLMGVGTPIDLLEAVHRGVDMFDCIIPTKLSEQGVAYTSEGRLQLIRGSYRTDETPVDAKCPCETCRNYSRAYVHHLVKACEPLATQLLGEHNLVFYHSLMRDIRASILEGRFLELYRERREKLDRKDRIPSDSIPKVGRRPRRRPMSLGAFELVDASTELSSIRHIASGEIMHPSSDPMREARELYVAQSRLFARLQEASDEPLVVWDVGLGAGFNAMAIIDRLAPTKLRREEGAVAEATARPLHLVSFEIDMDALRLALHYPDRLPHVRHPAPHALIEKAHYEAPGLRWDLLEGDFLATFEGAPKPDLIFFDPFSVKVDAPMWQEDVFRRIFAKLDGHPCRLFNYTNSTLVRARLMNAGFWVARGEATPPKGETTVALTPAAATEYPLLAAEFLERCTRSSAFDGADDRHLLARLREHPQFAGGGAKAGC